MNAAQEAKLASMARGGIVRATNADLDAWNEINTHPISAFYADAVGCGSVYLAWLDTKATKRMQVARQGEGGVIFVRVTKPHPADMVTPPMPTPAACAAAAAAHALGRSATEPGTARLAAALAK